MLINCNIGYQDFESDIDERVISSVDIINIASHKDNKDKTQHYQELAQKHDVKVSALLSYPKENERDNTFQAISTEDLIASLEEQLLGFEAITCVRFHGRLYDHANRSAELADHLAAWLHDKGIKEVIAPYRSMLHKACTHYSISVLYEAFADRTYKGMNLGLELMSKDHIGSTLEDIQSIVRQVRKLKNGTIEIDGHNYLVEVDTIHVTADSKQRLKIIEAISAIL